MIFNNKKTDIKAPVIEFFIRGVAVIKIHLSELLGKQKITQAELARRTDIRPNTINEIYWELVDRINLEHLEKICNVLGCKIGDLLEIVPDD